VVDSEHAHLFGSLVRLAAGYEDALALIDRVLGTTGAQDRLSPWELASARSEAASCRAQLAAVRLRVDTQLEGGGPEELSPATDALRTGTS
jgi:hypothetical protein